MDLTAVLRWCGGGALFLGFLFLAVTHGVWILRAIILKKKVPSFVPLVGGVMGALALLLVPLPGASRFWWVPLFADFGSIPLILWTAVWHAFFRLRREKRGHH